MCKFSDSDVLALAKAVITDPLIYMDGDYTPYWYCLYCDAEHRGYNTKTELFIHDVNCPVRIAQDILTGFK